MDSAEWSYIRNGVCVYIYIYICVCVCVCSQYDNTTFYSLLKYFITKYQSLNLLTVDWDKLIMNDETGRREGKEVLSYLDIFWSTLTKHENTSQDKIASSISERQTHMIYSKLCHNHYIASVNEWMNEWMKHEYAAVVEW